MHGVFAFILLAFALVLTLAMNKAHRESTGVEMPSTNAWRRIRRTARRKGISQELAYQQWLSRKQKRASRVSSDVSSKAVHTPEVVEATQLTNRSKSKPKVAQLRAPAHEPFNFEQLSEMAATYGLKLRKQAGGLYYIVGPDNKIIVNPYADEDAIRTDFTHQDAEDYLLTC
jgi:hypothetical protein